MSVKNFILTTVALPLFVALAGGCSSVASLKTVGAPVASSVTVYEGMPVSELLEVMNDPVEVRKVESPRDGLEIWVYRRSISNVEYKAVTTEEIPYFDPLTGEYRPMVEPVLKSETSVYTIETQFLIADEVVVKWKTKSAKEKRFD